MADDLSSIRDRQEGRARTGTVGLRSFDEGIVRTLRTVLVEPTQGQADYYLQGIEGLDLAPGMPGVPIVFTYPEDAFAKYKVPVITVNRDDIEPAMNRWHPGSLQYRAPAPGAHQVTVRGRTGFDRYEEMQQAVPYDLTYSLVLYTRTRNQGNILMDYCLRIYPPYCNVKVLDSIGDFRLYAAFTEGIGSLDDVPEIGDRVIAFAVTLRVEAELDLNDPYTYKAVMGTTTRTRGI